MGVSPGVPSGTDYIFQWIVHPRYTENYPLVLAAIGYRGENPYYTLYCDFSPGPLGPGDAWFFIGAEAKEIPAVGYGRNRAILEYTFPAPSPMHNPCPFTPHRLGVRRISKGEGIFQAYTSALLTLPGRRDIDRWGKGKVLLCLPSPSPMEIHFHSFHSSLYPPHPSIIRHSEVTRHFFPYVGRL